MCLCEYSKVMHEECWKNNEKINAAQKFRTFSRYLNASHIRACLSRRRIRGRKTSRSGDQAAPVSILQIRCVTGTQRLSSSVVIMHLKSVSDSAAITTLGDKHCVPVTRQSCSVDTDSARAPDRNSFLPRTRLRGK